MGKGAGGCIQVLRGDRRPCQQQWVQHSCCPRDTMWRVIADRLVIFSAKSSQKAALNKARPPAWMD